MPVPEPSVNEPQEFYLPQWQSEATPKEGTHYWVVLSDDIYASNEIAPDEDQSDYVTVAYFIDGEFYAGDSTERLENIIQYAEIPPLDPAQIYRIRYRSKRAREREN